MVGVRGFEPPASRSQTEHASHCATPREKVTGFYNLEFKRQIARSQQSWLITPQRRWYYTFS